MPVGFVSAVRRNQWIGHVVRGVSLLGLSSPVFWLGLVAQFVWSFRLAWLPGWAGWTLRLEEPAHLTGMP